jgi:hypothetical protein
MGFLPLEIIFISMARLFPPAREATLSDTRGSAKGNQILAFVQQLVIG